MPALTWWLLALPLLAGVLLPLQAGINGQLAKHLGSVLLAALISFCVGTLALLLLTLYQREMPLLGAFRGLSWWHWTGGLLGAFFIATAAYASPRTGALQMKGEPSGDMSMMPAQERRPRNRPSAGIMLTPAA